jgi:hypothetical protein
MSGDEETISRREAEVAHSLHSASTLSSTSRELPAFDDFGCVIAGYCPIYHLSAHQRALVCCFIRLYSQFYINCRVNCIDKE